MVASGDCSARVRQVNLIAVDLSLANGALMLNETIIYPNEGYGGNDVTGVYSLFHRIPVFARTG